MQASRGGLILNASSFLGPGAHVGILPDSTNSGMPYQVERIKIMLFGFAAGQELSEHSADIPAINRRIK